MRILILALGSRGDVQPYLTLGGGLHAAGHEVTVASFAVFEPQARRAGVGFFPLRGDAEALLRQAASDGMLVEGKAGANPLRAIRALKRSYGELQQSLPADLSSLPKFDLILNQLPSNLFGYELACWMRAKLAIVSVIPLARTRAFPLIGFPRWPQLIPGYSALTYRLGEQVGWQMFRGAINRWRVKALNLPPETFFGPFERLQRERLPVINGFSELVVPRPPDWGAHIHLTGWWQPEDLDWQPPVSLLRFLEAGPAPVFFGLGSMPVDHPKRVTAIAVEAARQAGLRLLLHAGWAGLGGQLGEDVYQLSEAPYGWLFPRMAAIAHHGGSGTTGFALRSGAPSFVIPFAFDQFGWGERSAALGVGPPPLPFRRLAPDRLAQAFSAAVTRPAYRIAAAALGEQLSAENGVSTAVKIISTL